jgi:hypothetical protein
VEVILGPLVGRTEGGRDMKVEEIKLCMLSDRYGQAGKAVHVWVGEVVDAIASRSDETIITIVAKILMRVRDPSVITPTIIKALAKE